MIKYLLLFITALIALSFNAQKERFQIIEQAINLPTFIKLVDQQTIFNTEKELTIYIDSSLIELQKYTFNKKKIGYYDISDPINRMSVTYNFIFTKLDFDTNEAQVNFTFYPNWLIEVNGNKQPSYNNGNFIKVECLFSKENKCWKLKKSTLHDIEFQDWMFAKGSSFDYITEHYRPLK